MCAIEAKAFSGYGGLVEIELPRPQPAKDRVLVRVTAAGVTPLDHTILSGGHPRETVRRMGRPADPGHRHQLCRADSWTREARRGGIPVRGLAAKPSR